MSAINHINFKMLNRNTDQLSLFPLPPTRPVVATPSLHTPETTSTDPGSNPDQLRLLARPSEILGRLRGFLDSDELEWDEITPERYAKSKMHLTKLEEAHRSGLADSMRSEGVKLPIVLMPPGPKARAYMTPEQTSMSRVRHFQMGNGHHRLAAAFELEQQGHDIHLPLIYDRFDPKYDVRTIGDYDYQGKKTIVPTIFNDPPNLGDVR
jgi:hypothetical protein